MLNINITAEIDKVLQRYYNKEDECFREYRTNEVDEEFNICKELNDLFSDLELNKSIVSLDFCFDSPGYSCDMLSIAWVENDRLHMENILLESF